MCQRQTVNLHTIYRLSFLKFLYLMDGWMTDGYCNVLYVQWGPTKYLGLGPLKVLIRPCIRVYARTVVRSLYSVHSVVAV